MTEPGTMPPLPNSALDKMSWMGDPKPRRYYTADQMRAYARTHAAALEARCDRLEAALKSCMPFIDDAMDVQQLFPESAASKMCRRIVKLARDALSEKP
jgi:hypothetical protein